MLQCFTAFAYWLFSEEDTDQYVLQCSKQLQFKIGEEKMCHNYILEQDFNCELKENTTHFEIRLVTSANQLDIKPSLSTTTVTIDDSRESECCKLCVFFL